MIMTVTVMMMVMMMMMMMIIYTVGLHADGITKITKTITAAAVAT